MFPIGKEATEFVRVCETIHGLVARGELAPQDRELIEFSGTELLDKVRPTSRAVHDFPFRTSSSSPTPTAVIPKRSFRTRMTSIAQSSFRLKPFCSVLFLA